MTYAAIKTKYHGPTNFKGARISASNGTERVSIPYPYELSSFEAHKRAAIKLITEQGYGGGKFFAGEIAGGWVFINAGDATEPAFEVKSETGINSIVKAA